MIDDDIYIANRSATKEEKLNVKNSFYFSLKNVRMMFLSTRSPLCMCDSNPVHSKAQIILVNANF